MNYDAETQQLRYRAHGSLSSLASELRAHGARSWSRCFTGAEMIDLNAELQRIDRAREETHKRGEESRKFAARDEPAQTAGIRGSP